MIIHIRRSGGFAGIEEDLGTIDSAALGAQTASRVADSVAELTRMQAEGTGPVGADLFRYEIEIQDDQGRRHQVVVMDEGDPTMPSTPALRTLLDAVAGAP